MCSGSVGSGRSVPSVSAPRPVGRTAACDDKDMCDTGLGERDSKGSWRHSRNAISHRPLPQPELPTQWQGAGADGQHRQLDLLCRSALCITKQQCRQPARSISSSVYSQESKHVLLALPPGC